MDWCIQCDDATLRAVLRAPMGPEVPQLMLDAVAGGVTIEVTSGGKARRVDDRASALALLKDTADSARRERDGSPDWRGHH